MIRVMGITIEDNWTQSWESVPFLGTLSPRNTGTIALMSEQYGLGGIFLHIQSPVTCIKVRPKRPEGVNTRHLEENMTLVQREW